MGRIMIDDSQKFILRDRLKKANIGPQLWKLRLDELGNEGKLLREALLTNEITSDCDSGIVYNIYGDANRIDVIAALAKELSIFGNDCYYLSIRQMQMMLDYDDRVEKIYDAGILFINNFYEKEFESPLQGDKRFQLEDVLNYRLDGGKPIFICSSTRLNDIKWWSQTLLHKMTKNSKEIYVSKSKHNRG